MLEHYNDFHPVPWAQEILTSPSWIPTIHVDRKAAPPLDKLASNRLMGRSLNNESCIRAWKICRREEVKADGEGERDREEWVCLLSVGDGLDGWDGKMHGGFMALLMENLIALMGSDIMRRDYHDALIATKDFKVKYRKAVNTPCLLLVKAWVGGWEGKGNRDLRMVGTLEDGEGGVFASCESWLRRGGDAERKRVKL